MSAHQESKQVLQGKIQGFQRHFIQSKNYQSESSGLALQPSSYREHAKAHRKPYTHSLSVIITKVPPITLQAAQVISQQIRSPRRNPRKHPLGRNLL